MTEHEPSLSAPPSIRISCVVCTYRNADLLEKTIRSLVAQDLPRAEYELIVVDNNSQDKTEGIIRSFMDEPDSNVRYILETQQGLSFARNRGIDEACSDIIAFTDDDAEAEPQWLRALLAVYDAYPDAESVGGKTVPIWGGDRPDWLTDEFYPNISVREWGMRTRPLEWPERNIGVNCSFRKQVFDEIGGFATDLGRKGKALMGSEDTEIQERLHAQGMRVYYTPDAVVGHYVPPDRMVPEYFYRRAQGHSRTVAMRTFQQQGRGGLLALMLKHHRYFYVGATRYAKHLLGRRAMTVKDIMMLCNAWGTMQAGTRLLFLGDRSFE